MKLLPVMLVLALATLTSSSLLEMSQVLWTRLLSGGYRKVGTLDPLHVPVIKVDQSEGDTSYRVILRNLEVTGLNASRIESVHVVRGSLRSNLSDGEAGYVSYNEQRGLDSIRYRFHTLIKERKSQSEDRDQSASDQLERIVEYDPSFVRARDEEELLRSSGQGSQQQRYYANIDASRDNRREGQQQQQQYNSTYQSSYGDMRVAVNPTPRNPSSVRVVYTHNYRSNGNSNVQAQDQFVRPCIGACKPIGRVETQRFPTQQGQFSTEENSQTRIYQDQRYNGDRVIGASELASGAYAMNAQVGGSSFSAGLSNGQRQGQFAVKGGDDSRTGYASNYRSGQISVEGQKGENVGSTEQRPSQFSVKSGNSGVSYSGNYRNGPITVEGQSGENVGPNQQRPNQFSIKSGNSEVRYAGYRNGPITVEGQSGENVRPSEQRPSQFAVRGGTNSGVNYSGSYGNGPISVESNGGQYAGSNGQRQSQFSVTGGIPSGSRVSEVQGSASSTYERRAQIGRDSLPAGDAGVKQGSSSGINYSADFGSGGLSVEGQTGSSDQPSVYFKGSTSRPTPTVDDYRVLCKTEEEYKQAMYRAAQRSRFGEQTTPLYTEKVDASRGPLVRLEKQPGYVDIVYVNDKKQGSESRIESLRVAPPEDPRTYGLEEVIKDLRGNQRYIIHNFTEGESLNKRNDAARVSDESRRIKDLLRYAKEYQEKQGYFEEGMELIYHFGDLNDTSRSKLNETLTRRKRQHANDTDEDDVMHVVVRIRVPMLSVKSGYALMGKVGKQLLRGNGLLAGNFTDVVADFTVELKKVDNKTMIVRAARAKLVSKDRKVKLQGMDEKGPVDAILVHGLMAAEAVAAMIADDLATKALSEGNADGMVYKMYKNLPVIEKS